MGITVLVIAGVLYRYVLRLPLIWSSEVISAGMVWLTFIGSAVAVTEGKHMRAELIDMILPQKIAKYWNALVDIVCVVLLSYLFLLGVRTTLYVWPMRTDTMRISVGYEYLAIPIGIGLMAMLYLSRLIAPLLQRTRPVPQDESFQKVTE